MMEQSSLLMSARVHFLVSLLPFKVDRKIPVRLGLEWLWKDINIPSPMLTFCIEPGSSAQHHPYSIEPVSELLAFNSPAPVPVGRRSESECAQQRIMGK